MTKLYQYLNQLLTATAFTPFQNGIVTEVTESELALENSHQKTVNLKLLKEQYLQVALTTEWSEDNEEPTYIISMQFIEENMYVNVIDDALFLTFIHLVDEVYQYMQPIIHNMNTILRNNGVNIRVDTEYVQAKIEQFKNATDDMKEQIYSTYNVLFI